MQGIASMRIRCTSVAQAPFAAAGAVPRGSAIRHSRVTPLHGLQEVDDAMLSLFSCNRHQRSPLLSAG